MNDPRALSLPESGLIDCEHSSFGCGEISSTSSKNPSAFEPPTTMSSGVVSGSKMTIVFTIICCLFEACNL